VAIARDVIKRRSEGPKIPGAKRQAIKTKVAENQLFLDFEIIEMNKRKDEEKREGD
jgi:hypothetical protein